MTRRFKSPGARNRHVAKGEAGRLRPQLGQYFWAAQQVGTRVLLSTWQLPFKLGTMLKVGTVSPGAKWLRARPWFWQKQELE